LEPDTAEVIDRVLSKLPEVYRAAVVACDLQGLSRKEAARQLGWTEGTLSGRLARARKLLAERLSKLGLSLPAGGLATVLGTETPVRAGLTNTVMELVTGAAAVGVPAPLAALTCGVVPSMLIAKMKFTVAVVLAAGVLGLSVWAAPGLSNGSGQGPADGKAPTSAKTPKHQPGLDLRVALSRLEFARKHLADTLKDQQNRDHRGDWPPDTPDLLDRELGRFQADLDTLQQLLKESRTALNTARAVGPAGKVSSDLVEMQGQWRLRTVWDGKKYYAVPSKTAAVFQITGNTLSGPFRDPQSEKFTIELRPDKSVPEIDFVRDGKRWQGIYRFTPTIEPHLQNLWLATALSGERPTSFEPDGLRIEIIELTRVTDEKPQPGEVIEGVNIKPAEQRRQLALQELQLLLVSNEHQRPATTVEEYGNQLERDRVRVAAIQGLLEEARKDFEMEKQRAANAAAQQPGAPLKPCDTFTLHIRLPDAPEKVITLSAESMTVLDAVNQGRDIPLIRRPESLSVWVLRNKVVMPVDLDGIVTKGQAKTNYILKPSDRLFVQVKVGE
jgi:hypothetical protein